MNKIIIIEGARNVGKTYLIEKLGDVLPTYKFPFAKYFNESFTTDIDTDSKQALNGERELFFLTLGYDITIFDLAKKGLLRSDIIVDRGILSDIIFGIQSGRINEQTAIDAWNWLIQEYDDVFEIVYINAIYKEDDRNKDAWDHYNKDETIKLTIDFLDKVNYDVHMINNKFNISSVNNFRNGIIDLIS